MAQWLHPWMICSAAAGDCLRPEEGFWERAWHSVPGSKTEGSRAQGSEETVSEM